MFSDPGLCIFSRNWGGGRGDLGSASFGWRIISTLVLGWSGSLTGRNIIPEVFWGARSSEPPRLASHFKLCFWDHVDVISHTLFLKGLEGWEEPHLWVGNGRFGAGTVRNWRSWDLNPTPVRWRMGALSATPASGAS